MPAKSSETPATPANIPIWETVEKTDPNYTKSFKRGGGFQGTAINATYLAKKATDVFGPCGIGWGMEVVDEQIMQGAPLFNNSGDLLCHEQIHKVRVRLWYKRGDTMGHIEQFGQTQFVGRNSKGLYTDEEAPKKSLTDGMTKCLSLLGFGADIHLGLYDDNKYVENLWSEFGEGKQAEPAPQREAPPPKTQAPARPAQTPKRQGSAKMTVAQHVVALKGAGTFEELKAVFAKAWREYEDPRDPKTHTEAQLKLKAIYDQCRADLIPPSNDAQQEAFDDAEQEAGEFDLDGA